MTGIPQQRVPQAASMVVHACHPSMVRQETGLRGHKFMTSLDYPSQKNSRTAPRGVRGGKQSITFSVTGKYFPEKVCEELFGVNPFVEKKLRC